MKFNFPVERKSNLLDSFLFINYDSSANTSSFLKYCSKKKIFTCGPLHFRRKRKCFIFNLSKWSALDHVSHQWGNIFNTLNIIMKNYGPHLQKCHKYKNIYTHILHLFQGVESHLTSDSFQGLVNILIQLPSSPKPKSHTCNNRSLPLKKLIFNNK